MNGKSKTTAALLAFFLGGLGVHNFYLGFTGKAIAQLLITILSVGTLAWISYLWAFVEFILILTGKIAKDAAGIPFDTVQPITQAQQTFVQPLAAQPMTNQFPTTATVQQPAATPTSATSAQTVSCPFCGEEISSKAIKCKHCQSMLNGSACAGATQQTAVVDRSAAVEQFVLNYHQNHRAKTPAIKKGLFGTSRSHVYGGDEITSDLLALHQKNMMQGFDPSVEKPLLVINKPGSLGLTTGLVLTNKNLYYNVAPAKTFAMSKINGKMDINSIQSMVIGDHDTALGSAYNGHDFCLNGQRIGWLRMGTDACLDDETLYDRA
jgi:TM2 domain-containing membrane protein YozV